MALHEHEGKTAGPCGKSEKLPGFKIGMGAVAPKPWTCLFSGSSTSFFLTCRSGHSIQRPSKTFTMPSYVARSQSLWCCLTGTAVLPPSCSLRDCLLSITIGSGFHGLPLSDLSHSDPTVLHEPQVCATSQSRSERGRRRPTAQNPKQSEPRARAMRALSTSGFTARCKNLIRIRKCSQALQRHVWSLTWLPLTHGSRDTMRSKVTQLMIRRSWGSRLQARGQARIGPVDPALQDAKEPHFLQLLK